MSLLGSVAEAPISGARKIGAIAALVAGASSSGYSGYQWHMPAYDCNGAIVGHDTARDANAVLTASIREQNRAVEALAADKNRADERRAAAEQLAAANGRRLDCALE